MAKSLEESRKDLAVAESRIKNNKELLEQIKIDLQQYSINSPMYNKAKQRAKKINADIKKYEAELKAAKEVVDKANEAEAKIAAKKKAEKDAARIEERAKRLEDAGDTAAAAKIRKDAADAKAAADAAAKAKADAAAAKARGVQTGSQFQVSDSALVGNELAKANVTFDGGRPIVQYNFTDKDGNQSVNNAYLYVTTTGGGTGEKAFFFGSSDVVRDRYQKQLIKNYGSKQAVIDKLFKAGLLSTNKNVSTNVYLAALDAAAAEFTVAQVNAYKQEGVKEFATIDEYLAARKNTGTGTGLGGTRTRPNVLEYSDTAAKKIINAISQQFYGRDANAKELSKLIPLINKELKNNPDLISTTTDAQGNVIRSKTKTGLDVEQFLIDEISQKDEAKARQVLGYYDVFKQSIGVN